MQFVTIVFYIIYIYIYIYIYTESDDVEKSILTNFKKKRSQFRIEWNRIWIKWDIFSLIFYCVKKKKKNVARREAVKDNATHAPHVTFPLSTNKSTNKRIKKQRKRERTQTYIHINIHTHTHGPTVTHSVFVFFWTYLRLGFFGTVITTPPNSDDNDVDVHDDEDELGGERHRFRGGRYSLRYAMVVRLRRNFLLSGPLRRYHVGPHSGSHVIGPRRPRNPPT